MVDKPTSKDQPSDLRSKVELTGRSMMQKLRMMADPPGRRAGWFAKLNDKQLAEVYHRLKLGQTLYKIAQICQNDWGYQTHAPVKNLIAPIRAFRDKALTLLEQEKQEPSIGERKTESNEHRLSKRARKISDKLDGMNKLAWLIERQAERLEILFAKEVRTLPFKFTDRSVEVMASMLERFIKFQIDLGILDSKPSEHNVLIKHQFEGILQHALPPGTAMPEVALRYLKKCEENSLTLAPGQDGIFSMGLPPEEEEEDEYQEEEGYEEE